MLEFAAPLLGFRVALSFLGIVGNVVLILSIVRNPVGRLKTFNVFLLGLASANLESIVIVDVYDVVVMLSASRIEDWSCRTLKFLTVFGEVASIFCTVLISVFRCQKLRGARTRGNRPIFLDRAGRAWATSGLCVTLSLLLGFPTYLTTLDAHVLNVTASTICPADFYQCDKYSCPLLNRLYKYLSLLICILLPLLIITVSSCLIIKVLLAQRRVVKPALGPGSRGQKEKRIRRSTVAVLTAMTVFQVDWAMYLFLHLYVTPSDWTMYLFLHLYATPSDWTMYLFLHLYATPSDWAMYLFLHLYVTPSDFAHWSTVEFFITTVYTTSSPYVYGIGNSLFSRENLRRR